MRCFIKNCHTKSTGSNGRIICVEPDDDGWICEHCWQFLNTGIGTESAAYLLGQPEAVAASESRAREIENFYEELSAMSVASSTHEDNDDDDEDEDIDNALRAMADEEDEDDAEIDSDEFYEQLQGMNEGDPSELDAIMDHIGENGISRLSYKDFIYSKGMDRVRAEKLDFHNFGITEKVYLKRIGVSLWRGDTYERDACRCRNFACDIRWHQVVRPEGWTLDEEYVRYLELINHYGRDIRPIDSIESVSIRQYWPAHF